MTAFERHFEFLSEFARRLHLCGVSASRLEGAVRATAAAIGVSCEIWYTPTGILLSLGDARDASVPQHTRVMRVEPASVDLSSLASLDDIAERVIGGTLSAEEASAEFRELDRPRTAGRRILDVVAFGLSAGAVAGLFRTGWLDVAAATAIGILVGLLATLGRGHPQLSAARDAIAGLVATLLATAFAHFVAPLSLQTVVIASIIVLLPGLGLTTAVSELASQQLVAGTTRLAGAVMVLLKLTFGSIAGTQIAVLLGWTARVRTGVDLPPAFEVVAAFTAAASFVILFRAKRRDIAIVLVSALLGYSVTRVAGAWFASLHTSMLGGGVFLSSLLIAALANLYGRVSNRPGALVRVPGIMLMVPGSVGFRGLAYVLQHDYAVGLDTGVAVLNALVALTAGLLFGSLVVPPRRYL
jgi:uncharacterized membrane protein YjjP (DUF1212 family)